MTQYTIIDGKDTTLEDLTSQLRAIVEWPANIKIYDRVIIISNRDEMWALLHGLEIAFYMAEDKADAAKKLPAIMG